MSSAAGFLVRPAEARDAEDMSLVHIRTWQHAYADVFPSERLAALADTYAARAEHWREHIAVPDTLPILRVADVEGQGVVGFSGAGKQSDPAYRYDGEVYVLYVLPEYQRRGIGQALLRAAGEALHASGFKTLLLWALVQNSSARNFYKMMGGRVVGERPYFRWGTSYPLIGYAWDDLGALIGR